MSRTALCFDDGNQPHLLDTSQHDDPANNLCVEIVRSLSGDIDGDNQELLVKVLSKPTTNLKLPVPDTQEHAIVKIFDPMFYPEYFPAEEGPWKVTSRADMRLSREAGAYKELHDNNLTGYPHLAPQYYGSELLAGVVEPVYKGVWHEYVEPENVLVTMGNKSAILETPRVALIAYDISTIDSKCKKTMNRWERFPHPPHPAKCFDLAKLYGFGGWWPLEWGEAVEKGEEPPFKTWLLKMFGPLDSEKYSYLRLYRRQWLVREKQIKQELERRAKRQVVGAKREAAKDKPEAKS
ncbi:hypothetical protein BDP81DRAFT_446315 [Colletotrichum phormii]|uniref:Uncharacterized protein n=1 Tax=Colletotrichum phormii TaxID=359342 RepID=A0AAJ0A3I5_9PEZI|nr:uncharacterized protein BDP81DRAFT_446315 [Colletotrichum phormii]KAK1641417.1 hypothetical protein BDP81DRAFT_446315 [Colletotrichum phormii]